MSNMFSRDITTRLIDVYGTLQKLNPQEQQLFAKYGKLPTHKNALMKMQKVRRTWLNASDTPRF
jgi:hypothetical protein